MQFLHHLIQEENNHYKKENEYYKILLENAGTMLKSSVSSLTHIINNYGDAPHIKTIKMKDIKSNDIDDNIKFISLLLYHYNKKTINKYLGDMIVTVYKQQDPTKQSIWNTDHTRLNYLIKELIDKTTSDWIIDKKGIKTKKYLINPLLVHIKSMLLSHRKSLLENLEQENAEVCEKIANNMKNIAEMIKNIDDGVLSEGILKYISPHLYMDNKLQLK